MFGEAGLKGRGGRESCWEGGQVGRPPVAGSDMEETSSTATLLAQHKVPIIDVAHITKDLVCPVKSCTRQSATKLHKALMETGYAFLVNHGITEQKLQAAYCKFDTFCSLPDETKSKYVTEDDNSRTNHYIKPGPKVVGKLHEFKHEYHVRELDAEKLPENDVPGFSKAINILIDDLTSLSSIILQFIAIGWDVEPNYLLKHHDQQLNTKNESHFEMVYYPPMDDCKPSNESTSSEKNDSGTFTIICQDQEIGMEVLHGNKWVPIGFLPGALLLRAGLSLQKWTDGIYKPTSYRMTVAKDNNILSRSRHCAFLYIQPQNEANIEPIYITAYEFQTFYPTEQKKYCTLRRAYLYFRRKLRQLCR